MPFNCAECDASFTRKFHRDRHMFHIHANKNLIHLCRWCGAVFKSVRQLKNHRLEHRPNTQFTVWKRGPEGKCVIYRKAYDRPIHTFDEAVLEDKKETLRLLNYEWLIRNSMKATIVYHVELIRMNGEEEERQEVCLRERARMINQPGDIEILMRETRLYIQKRLDDWTEAGSGFVLDEVICCDIELGTCKELTGSCGLMSIINRSQLKKIKPGSESNTCFLDAIAYHFVRTEDPDIISDYIEKKLVVTVPMPMKVRNIPRFEADNAALGIKVNVLMVEDNQVFPVFFSKNTDVKEHINLVLYHSQEGEDSPVLSHFCYIKDINKFLGKTSGNKRKRNEGERCLNCFTKFRARSKEKTQEMLKKHYPYCVNNKCTITTIPEEGVNDKLEFKNFNKKYRRHFWGCFDIETKQVLSGKACAVCTKNNSPVCRHKTTTHAEQQPIILSFVLLDDTKTVVYKESFVGETCVEDFLSCLVTLEPTLLAKLQAYPEYDKSSMTRAEREDFENSTVCHICEQELLDDRCIDHNHVDGSYRGAAHTSCNIMLYDKKVSLYAHNLSGFDSNFLMQKIGSVQGIRNLHALPRNTEKMRSISFNCFVLLDSLAFLNGSLDTLVKDLCTNPEQKFDLLDQMGFYNHGEDEKRKMLLRKQSFPYEYCTSLEKIKLCKKIPKKEDFHSILTDSDITQEDYDHCVKVFETFKMDSLLSFYTFYCEVDTILLCEVLWEFRQECYEAFGLDFTKFLSTPQLAMDAFLYKTKASIPLLTDWSKYSLFEQNLRGGTSFIAERHSRAQYDPKTGKHTVLLYLDENNLYGGAQCLPLADGNFKWEKGELLNVDYIMKNYKSWSDDDLRGMVFEADWEYPEHLHMKHNSFPLMPESRTVTEKMLSEYSLLCYKTLYGKDKYSDKKLMTTFLPKNRYVCHYMNMREYLNLGMVLKKVHRCLSFTQSRFIEPFIKICTEKRRQAKTTFKKSLYKLFSNSLFGKTIESVRERYKVQFCTKGAALTKLISSPLFHSFRIISSDLCLVYTKEREVLLNKPIQIGFTVLDRSKQIMYHRFYNNILTSLPQDSKVTVSLTDTDSLLLKIESKLNIDGVLDHIKHLIDFSNYPSESKRFSKKHQNALYYLKDELGGKILKESVGLRSKTYGLRILDNKGIVNFKAKSKGTKRAFQKQLFFGHYTNCIEAIRNHEVTQFSIKTKGFVVTTEKCKKLAFSSFDSKRWLHQECRLKIHSSAYGSKWIKHAQQTNTCPYC